MPAEIGHAMRPGESTDGVHRRADDRRSWKRHDAKDRRRFLERAALLPRLELETFGIVPVDWSDADRRTDEHPSEDAVPPREQGTWRRDRVALGTGSVRRDDHQERQQSRARPDPPTHHVASSMAGNALISSDPSRSA